MYFTISKEVLALVEDVETNESTETELVEDTSANALLSKLEGDSAVSDLLFKRSRTAREWRGCDWGIASGAGSGGIT